MRVKEGKPKDKKTQPTTRDVMLTAERAFEKEELVGDIKVEVKGDVILLTNLDKLYWPEEGYTKGDLIRYYYQVSAYILPYLKDRPLIMKRYPNGILGESFHQHNVRDVPDYVRTASIEVEEGHIVDYILCDNLPTLLYVANLGAIERHVWHSRTGDLDHPDWFVFDLDPDNGVEFSSICEIAIAVKKELNGFGLSCYAKTSGSRGMHIYVPIKPLYGYDDVVEFAERLATRVTRDHSDIATIERSLKKRGRGRIYIDYLQNARGKSVVAPYSVRPRPQATVSTPVTWAEVARRKIKPQDFTINNILRRIQVRGEQFKPVLKEKQNLAKALRQLNRDSC